MMNGGHKKLKKAEMSCDSSQKGGNPGALAQAKGRAWLLREARGAKLQT